MAAPIMGGIVTIASGARHAAQPDPTRYQILSLAGCAWLSEWGYRSILSGRNLVNTGYLDICLHTYPS